MKKILLLSFLFATPFCIAEEHTVAQKDKQFSIEKLSIKVGDTVKFLNSDPFFHNIFSLSDTQMFDLGSFPEGEHKSVTFEEAGEVEVECAIHPEMMMVIEVKE